MLVPVAVLDCTAKLYSVFIGFVKRYRYCDYLGKYFCPCCHSNDRAYIPGRILRRWDFGKYTVSHFAFELLRRIYDEPLFSVELSSSEKSHSSSTPVSLYRKVKSLDQCRDCRIQLHFLRAFVETCTRPDRLARPEISRVGLQTGDKSILNCFSLHFVIQQSVC